jgi:DNA replication protein DnaC
MLATARDTIPEDFKQATFRSLDLAKWVIASNDAIRGAWEVLRQPVHKVLVTGPTGSGKTTLACAMLREVIDAAAKLDCDEATLERGRRARLYDAYDLSVARKEHRLGGGEPVDLSDAKTASVLVIDELGRDDKSTSDVWKIIHDRAAAKQLTIVTTWMKTQGEVSAAYDGGIARRLFENATLIELGPT